MYFAMRHLFMVVLIFSVARFSYGMTRAQLKKTLTGVKNLCVQKTGVAEEKINRIEEGVFNEEPKVMSYMTCIYKTMQVVKDERLNMDMMLKQIENLYPSDMKGPVRKTVDKCYHVQDSYSNLDEAIFFAVKCMYEADPPYFVFP